MKYCRNIIRHSRQRIGRAVDSTNGGATLELDMRRTEQGRETERPS
jgi:hypothetical protein